MSLRILKEHLPWIAPTTAIVLAATGVISFGPRDAAPVDVASEFEVSRTMTQNPVALGEQGIGMLPDSSGSIEALQAVVQQAPQVPEVTLAPVPVEPAVVTPAQPEVTPQQVSIEPEPSVSPTSNPGAFFAAAQANLAQDRSCVEDLRVLAGEARVYFPSGGLTADEAGMAQARLIGLVAQDCPHVEIVVEGHSDPSGDPAANLRLSQQRADAVLKRIAASGIDVVRFQSVGLGSQEPSRITGTQSTAYYDRRVEFEVREVAQRAGVTGFSRPLASASSACAAQLQAAVAQTKLFYSPRSITAPSDGMPAVVDLAARASACPDARLRVVGQFSDDPGSGETPATARLRAVALMSSLVAAGFDPEQIIIAAHSAPQVLAGQPGLSEHRVDFDIILEN
ncbi:MULTISPECIES: OmpA family protein [Marivita]|uniref:OmpA family protein n=1 Tax=Marivita cryptomonadis TaxID=505252 RepID=A0A9Q2S6Q6_9RHOB|nr:MULTISPECIES: OmpA family protein [Marivita]MCR9170271.1 OmpA family protein [Paracoccaceae bacterium]MBM2323416.1 OmpA family protein [Marivita cryptomonadis]MBM2333002.1 OmpA family protein [Marivita cryptomonadis]MBM2342583.1 OmpA family protein [Marivita cryptomonadis]MBM2347250.1 OmpA family protein [Marivita cryptomonadis]